MSGSGTVKNAHKQFSTIDKLTNEKRSYITILSSDIEVLMLYYHIERIRVTSCLVHCPTDKICKVYDGHWGVSLTEMGQI